MLESTDNTILITHGENGTEETTSVDVNPTKVLEHDNLVSDSEYVTIEHEEGSQTSVIKTEKLDNDLNDLSTKIDSVEAKIPTVAGSRNYVLGTGTAKTTTTTTSTELYDLTSAFDDVPDNSTLIIEFDWSVTAPSSTSKFRINRLISYSDGTPDQWHNMIIKDGTSSDVSTSSGAGHYSGLFTKVPYTGTEVSSRSINLNQTASSGTVTISNLTIRIGSLKSDWEPAPEDYDSKLAQKQNTLTSNASIGVNGTGLMQLYSYQMSYTVTSAVTEGSLNTYAKTVKKDTNLTDNPKLEYHFTAEIKEGQTSITVPLNNNDTTYFRYILIKYGQTSGSTQTAMINGLIFSLTGSNLTITRDSSTYNQVVSFSDIIDPSVSVQSSNQEQETE